MNHDDRDEVFESRVRTGVPMVRAAVCRAWSAHRCGCELDALLEAGARVLVKAATEATSEAEFIDELLRELLPEVERAATSMTSAGGAP
ncbi:MAG: hypothetical protein FJ096_05995 [Deltaproteobacteria bacterium]|nr:hypothetical protein [Deltaproteobacteria bacterium]